MCKTRNIPLHTECWNRFVFSPCSVEEIQAVLQHKIKQDEKQTTGRNSCSQTKALKHLQGQRKKKTNPKSISRVKQKSQIRHKRPNEQKNRKTTREENSHAAAGWNLASISEPGDLWLREAANAWCWNHSTLSLRDWLGTFAFLKTAHN